MVEIKEVVLLTVVVVVTAVAVEEELEAVLKKTLKISKDHSS